jgi:hypothetical protein
MLSIPQQSHLQPLQANNLHAVRADYFGDQVQSFIYQKNNIVRINNRIVGYSPQRHMIRSKSAYP